MKVYVVIETVDGSARIEGVYAEHEEAVEVAEELAEYAGLVQSPLYEDTWCDEGEILGDSNSPSVVIEAHFVVQ